MWRGVPISASRNKTKGLPPSQVPTGKFRSTALGSDPSQPIGRARYDQGTMTTTPLGQDPRGNTGNRWGLPAPQGLYNPRFEHDACGVGFVADLDNVESHEIVRLGMQMLDNLAHRGARGAEPESGDGAGMLVQLPHAFFFQQSTTLGITLPARGD